MSWAEDLIAASPRTLLLEEGWVGEDRDRGIATWD